MIDADFIAEAARRLDEAERTKVQMGQLSLEAPGLTIEDAYAIQRAWVERKLAAGRKLVGHKIGLTSRAMQQTSQIDEPDYGALLDDMMFRDGAEIPTDRFIEPRMEIELAFVLGKRLSGPGCTLFDVLAAADYVTPAIEIIDARIQRFDPDTGKPRRVMDTISDNAANAGVVLGGRPVRPHDVDLRWVGAICWLNGIVEETGVAAGVMNHPATGVAWLANKLAPYGVALEPGHIVLSGSFTRPVPMAKGDVFHVDYGGLGAVSFKCA
jgi:2-oxo-hept-3-ene-1,7-dioate hydratase